MLSPAETKALYPLMNVDDLYGTLYVPQDGTMDPAGTCTALSRAAAARGAQVLAAPAYVPCSQPGGPGALLDQRVLWGPLRCFSLFIQTCTSLWKTPERTSLTFQFYSPQLIFRKTYFYRQNPATLLCGLED